MSDLSFVPALQLRLVEAEELKAASLASIAAQLPALIDALKTSRSYGGGGKKKRGGGLLSVCP
jgi:hypothetical protein